MIRSALPSVHPGRAARLAALVAAALFFAGPSSVSAQHAPTLRSPETFDAAMADAQARRQLLLVYVSSKDCVWCRHFERTHLADPAFQAWMRALFQVVRVDGDDDRHLDWLRRRGLDVKVFPSFFLLDARGARIAASPNPAQFPPLKAVQLFDQVKGRDFGFDPAALQQVAREVSGYRQRAPSEELRLAYGAMEALTWHWLGNGANALAAFGPDVAPLLERGPGPGGDEKAWDEIRLWYAGFWAGYARANHGPAFRVAAKGWEERRLPQYAFWAALLAEQLGRFDVAARYGEAYVAATNPPANHLFRRRLAEWKQRAQSAPQPRR